MPNENVTAEDLKATARAKAENLKEEVEETAEETFARIKAVTLTTNQKLVLTGAVCLAASVVIQKLVQRFRPIVVDGDLVVITSESKNSNPEEANGI